MPIGWTGKGRREGTRGQWWRMRQRAEWGQEREPERWKGQARRSGPFQPCLSSPAAGPVTNRSDDGLCE